MIFRRPPIIRSLCAVLSILLGAGALGAAQPLPASPYAVHVDGNPREAFLLGAVPLRQYDAVSGARDGSVRAYALAVRDGLYVAVLSTEPVCLGGTTAVGQPPPPLSSVGPPSSPSPVGQAPSPAISVGRKPTPAMPPASPGKVLLRDWMAVRVQGAKDVLFVLDPEGRIVSLGEEGDPSGLSDLSWSAAGSHFGHTWAGEWLIPWSVLGLKAGDTCRLSALRGRKLVAGGMSLEVLNASSPEPSSSRWGGDGPSFLIPATFPPPLTSPEALVPFEVRPFLPDGAGRTACEEAAPAGEFVTAWLECPASADPVRVTVSGPLAGAEVFRVDFWWQAGTREEQDALFPARVASGAGDVLVAERLFPAGVSGLPPSRWPTRVYLRARVPLNTPPGALASSIQVTEGGRRLGEVAWRIEVAPPLPPTQRVAGMYYLDRDPARWGRDLRDMADHGFNAATCYARGEAAWERFVAAAKEAGMDGAFAMDTAGLKAFPGAWAYTVDEPTSPQALARVRRMAPELRARGFKAWTALCWPNSLSLAGVLDGYALDPNLVPLAGPMGLAKGRWTYVQGLREDPFFNRVWAGIFSHAFGLSGFWVFCYAAGAEGDTDWSHPYLRHDVCVENGPGGTRIQTVEWEALREGLLDSRLREALGVGARKVDDRFPDVAAALSGEYWKMDRRRWDAEAYRRALVEEWGAVVKP